MVLNAENRLRFVTHPFDGLIVQIDTINTDLRWQRFRIDGEAVILRSDLDAAGGEILHRLIGAAMTELEFEGFPSQGLAEDLVAQTNRSEERRVGKECRSRWS